MTSFSVYFCSTLVPRHPFSGIGGQFLGMALKFSQVVEGICSAKLAGVDQAHVQVADLRTIQCPIEQCVLTVNNRSLQCSFGNIMPTPGLCRVLPTLTPPAWLLTVPDAA
jgi:hypothetical protein